jgi:proton-translocating NAD(P)+ transhydrogenase subunit alpha
MKVAVPKERRAGESRVALVPESARRLIAKGFTVAVETGAGVGAGAADDDYRAAGASIAPSIDALVEAAELVVTIHFPAAAEIERMPAGSTLVGLFFPRGGDDRLSALAARRITAVALDAVPRTTLAQAMDALSSQSTAAGYRAVILAAHALPRFFPLLMTPAGTIPPARVLVLGAGVAGLQAIATARRLGAVVEAFDVRRAVKEEVESLGARFVEVEMSEEAGGAGSYAREIGEESQRRVRDVVGRRLAQADVCITTALVPGRRAPTLITDEMVRGMRPGSVIVDLAAGQGGNCEATRPGENVVRHGVSILGPLNAAGDVAVHASQMYSKNVEQLLLHLAPRGVLALDLDDPISRACVVIHEGRVRLSEPPASVAP